MNEHNPEPDLSWSACGKALLFFGLFFVAPLLIGNLLGGS